MFKGTYHHKMDPKGRLPVPAPFRRVLAAQGAGTVVVTLLDECLAAYPPSEWKRLEVQLAALPAFSRPVKALTRDSERLLDDVSLDLQWPLPPVSPIPGEGPSRPTHPQGKPSR